MLKLTPTPTEPTWVDLLPGVRLHLRPPNLHMILAARDAAAQIYRADLATETKDPGISTAAGIAMASSYARARILEWEGIGSEEGDELPASPENIDRAMGVLAFHESFDRLVLAPALNG